MYFLYSLCSSLRIYSTVVASKSMCTSVSMSKCRKAPVMLVTLHIAPSWCQLCMTSSWLPVTQWACWVLPGSCTHFATSHQHILMLMVTSLFSFKSIRYQIALFLLSYDMCSFLIGNSACRWSNSCSSAFLPLYHNLLYPLLCSSESSLHLHVVWQSWQYLIVVRIFLVIPAVSFRRPWLKVVWVIGQWTICDSLLNSF